MLYSIFRILLEKSLEGNACRTRAIARTGLKEALNKFEFAPSITSCQAKCNLQSKFSTEENLSSLINVCLECLRWHVWTLPVLNTESKNCLISGRSHSFGTSKFASSPKNKIPWSRGLRRNQKCFSDEYLSVTFKLHFVLWEHCQTVVWISSLPWLRCFPRV